MWSTAGTTRLNGLSSERGGSLRRLADQLIQADIGLARRSDVADFKTVGLKTILHQPDFLDADHLLHPVRNDEACGWRPDMAGVAKGVIAPLVDVA